MERWGHKLLALVLVFVLIFISTALPIKVSDIFAKKGRTGREILSFLACFGGGVFLGTYLIHMTPEVHDMLNEAWLAPNNITYPLPELIIAAGFFFVLLTDKIVGDISMKRKRKAADVEKPQSNGLVLNKNAQNSNDVFVVDSEKMKDVKLEHVDDVKIEPVTFQNTHSDEETASMARSIILMVALSLDCIFEGITLGLKDNVAGVWNMFIAIMSHEIVIAFSLGLEIVKYNTKARSLLGAFIYGITAPVGIAIGMVITEVMSAAIPNLDMVSGILQAISAGVFIYVTFMQILAKEFEYRTPWGRIIATILGVAVMAALAAIPEGEEHQDAGNSTSMALHA